MREIKFRVWCKENEQFIQFNKMGFLEDGSLWYVQGVDENEEETDPPYFENQNDWELMQYTGLNDKNGVEIYEGDILKISNTKRFIGRNYKCYSDIEIIGGHVYVWTDPVIDGQRVRYGAKMLLDGLAKYIDMRGVATSDVEVVGNIHEDKELLRSEAEHLNKYQI